MAPVIMKVTPSSATCEIWSLLMSINCGMNAPKNTSTLGFESSTTKPCRKNPPRGGGGGSSALTPSTGDRMSLMPSQTSPPATTHTTQKNQPPKADITNTNTH